MSAVIESASNGLLSIRITGKFTQAEWANLLTEAAKYIDQQGPIRVLIVAENFEGWERGSDWGDVSFQAKYDQAIERMALVGERRWEDLALMFTAKGFRPFPIEYFQPAELERAKAWLGEQQGKAR